MHPQLCSLKRRMRMKSSSMITLRSFRRLALALPLALPVSVSAQEPAWYAGLSAGRAYADINNSALASALQAGGYSTSQFQTEDNDYTFKMLGGYNFNPNFA